MNFLLKVWRQMNSKAMGKLVDYEVTNISPNTSFLEMLDILNDIYSYGARSQSHSIPIVVRVFAAFAA